MFNLADVIPGRVYLCACAIAAGLTNAHLAIASGYESALVSRFVTGAFLAGVYPPAMKMVATWFRRGRGLAVGTVRVRTLEIPPFEQKGAGAGVENPRLESGLEAARSALASRRAPVAARGWPFRMSLPPAHSSTSR